MTTEIVINAETKKPTKQPLVAGDVILRKKRLYLVSRVNEKNEFLLIDILDGNRYSDIPIYEGSSLKDLGFNFDDAVVLPKITITF